MLTAAEVDALARFWRRRCGQAVSTPAFCSYGGPVPRWAARSLLERVDPIEEAASVECLTARAALGLDIHEAKMVRKRLGVETPEEHWLAYARHEKRSVAGGLRAARAPLTASVPPCLRSQEPSWSFYIGAQGFLLFRG